MKKDVEKIEQIVDELDRIEMQLSGIQAKMVECVPGIRPLKKMDTIILKVYSLKWELWNGREK